MNGRQRCLAAIRGQAVDRAPVFPLLMFLAADRAGIPYRRFATEGRALAEAQLRVGESFELDALTACSDAFRLASDLGADMIYPEEATPYSRKPLVSGEADLARLAPVDPLRRGGRLADRVAAVAELARAVGAHTLVLGWVDMPFAEACSACGVADFLTMLYDSPALAHKLLEFLTPQVIAFSLAQLEAGAPMIGAGDAAASLVSPAFYREFALPYERRVVEAVHARGGLLKLHICGNTTALLPDMLELDADLYNVDHLVDLAAALDCFGSGGRCIKGNLDPAAELAFATPEQAQASALQRLQRAAGARYMLSAGCEVPASVSDATFRAFCRAPRLA